MNDDKNGYLILSRKPGEIIRIGNDIIIGVLSIERSQVKIGINAPHDIVILREELYQRDIQQKIVSDLLNESMTGMGRF